MSDPPYHLDIAELRDGQSPRNGDAQQRPWVGIRFDCCGVYNRIYRNREGTAYVGYCPRCMRRVCLRVGPDGTSSRFFVAE